MSSESKRRYAEHFKHPTGIRHQPTRVTIPANVERQMYHEPCFLCGGARSCRHRPESFPDSRTL